MRLIGDFETEKQAYAFYSFLLKEKIQNIYEPFLDEKTRLKHYRVWVYDEEDLQSALDWYTTCKEHPDDPRFLPSDLPYQNVPPTPQYEEISEKEDLKWKTARTLRVQKRPMRWTVVHLTILLCAFLFIWSSFEEVQIEKEHGPIGTLLLMTGVDRTLLFDFPKSYDYVDELFATYPTKEYKEIKELPPGAMALLQKEEDAPSWKGVYPFFQTWRQKGWHEATDVAFCMKIRSGEIWRLFTPCLLHYDFLHIFFNMAWVWILGKQMQQRMRAFKLIVLFLIIGVVSNSAQYLMGGPFFLGFSGIVVGMAGFIWVRQKRAPWEGYPLQKGTLLFLLFFVLAMIALEIFTFALEAFSVINLVPNIANTAHIVGGLVGMWLGRFGFFGRSSS
ncbi:MAG: rhomboid family intramembrane serine protease [Verrucomicrobia bacterium]|nr:rhomboid family intramembrane serine protease [Verrucomicrobiota bacterium]